MRRLFQTISVYFLLNVVCGCAVFHKSEKKSYETVVANPQRDTEEARKRNDKAIRFFNEGKIGQAREEVDQALIANVDFAPAHNTLGRILYCQEKYYLAAWEYQFAIQLQPNVPEYHNNLGLVYEAADRIPDAIAQYQTAVALEPDNYHCVANLARALIRQGNTNPDTAALLKDVVFLDPRKEWKDWARELLNTTHLDLASEGEVLIEETEQPQGIMIPPEVTEEPRTGNDLPSVLTPLLLPDP